MGGKGMSVKTETLPEEIIQAAYRRMDDIELLQLHPDRDEQEERNSRAYKVLKSKGLTHGEINDVEDAWGSELNVYFTVGYALGLVDGIATGRAVGEAKALTR